MILPFILVLSTSCAMSKPSKAEILVQDSIFFSNTLNLSTNSYYFDNKNNMEYLFHYDGFDKNMQIFDFKTGKYIKSIPLRNNINSYYVHNMDSIFVAYSSFSADSLNVIAILDGQGVEKNIFNFTKELQIKNNNSPIQMVMNSNPYDFFTFMFYENKFIIQVAPKEVDEKNKYNYPSAVSLSVKNNAIQDVKYINEYPEFYKKNNSYFAAYTGFTAFNHGILNTFVLSDSLNFLSSNGKTNWIQAKSKFKMKDYAYQISKHIKYDTYVFDGFKYPIVKYDKFRDVIYRVAIHKKEMDSSVQNWSLLVFDNKFNLIDEITISDNMHYHKNFFITKRGIAFIKQENVFERKGITIINNDIKF